MSQAPPVIPRPPVDGARATPTRFVDRPVDLRAIAAFVHEVRARQASLPVALGATDCRPVANAEVPDTFFCLSATQEDQNEIFTRASVYSEGSKYSTAGDVVPFDHPSYVGYIDRIWGHDIPSDNLIPFFREAEAEADYEQRDDCALRPAEKAFQENVLAPMLARSAGRRFAVITAFAALDPENLKGVVSHEALHAQYFLSEPLRGAVRRYWDEAMTADERAAVRADLGEFYDADNDYVILNEFLAYLASYGEPRSVGPMGPKKAAFIAFVEQASGVDLFAYPGR